MVSGASVKNVNSSNCNNSTSFSSERYLDDSSHCQPMLLVVSKVGSLPWCVVYVCLSLQLKLESSLTWREGGTQAMQWIVAASGIVIVIVMVLL